MRVLVPFLREAGHHVEGLDPGLRDWWSAALVHTEDISRAFLAIPQRVLELVSAGLVDEMLWRQTSQPRSMAGPETA
jgi:hypothetical protein